jgi:hypothetical protein
MEHERQQYELFLSAACDLVIEHKTVIQVACVQAQGNW